VTRLQGCGVHESETDCWKSVEYLGGACVDVGLAWTVRVRVRVLSRWSP
jgi:hypothetical protein